MKREAHANQISAILGFRKSFFKIRIADIKLFLLAHNLNNSIGFIWEEKREKNYSKKSHIARECKKMNEYLINEEISLILKIFSVEKSF